MILRYVFIIILFVHLISCSNNSSKDKLPGQKDFNTPEIPAAIQTKTILPIPTGADFS